MTKTLYWKTKYWRAVSVNFNINAAVSMEGKKNNVDPVIIQ